MFRFIHHHSCDPDMKGENVHTAVKANSASRRLLALAAIFAVGVGITPRCANAQEGGVEEEIDRSWEWAERSFVIVNSVTGYDDALDAAIDASSNMDLLLNLRDLQPNGDIGLTWSDSDCASNGWEPPCYVARGRSDNGVYVSIEHSSGYEGFAEGYYIVVVASGADDSQEILNATLQKARAFYPDAYAKKTRVYMGCMH